MENLGGSRVTGTVTEKEPWVRSGGYGLLGIDGYVVRVEFDGLSAARGGLQDFVERWANALTRPSGAAFVLILEYRELAIPVMPGTEPKMANVPVTSFLLLRVDSAHPYFGNLGPGWIVVRPSLDSSLSSEIIAAARDLGTSD